MAKVFGPPEPRRPRYKLDIGNAVMRESIFPEFEFDLPTPVRPGAPVQMLHASGDAAAHTPQENAV
jgi:hypothetical protein